MRLPSHGRRPIIQLAIWIFITGLKTSLGVEVRGESAEKDNPKAAPLPPVTRVEGDPKELTQFVIAGMRRERLKLKSGSGTFTGSMLQDRIKDPENSLNGELHGMFAIDGDKFRYDITRQGWIADPSTIKQSGEGSQDAAHVTAQMCKGTLRKMYADNGLRVAVWSADQGFAVISKPEAFQNGRMISEYVDLRAAVLFDRLAITRCRTIGDVFKSLEDMSKRRVTEVHSVGGTVWRIRWFMPQPEWLTRWTLVIDTSNFAPSDYRCESVKRTEADREESWILEWRNRAEWDERGGIWFPIYHEFHSPAGPFSRATETFRFKYIWDVVNDPIDPKLFTYETFDLPAHVGIQDVSGDKPVLIRPPTAADSRSGSAPVTRQTHDEWLRFRLVLAINAGALVVVLLVVWRWRAALKR